MYKEICFILQRPYINQSAMSVKSNFSLHRTYIIFRTLGLRHLVITNSDGGEVVGMITRRDLMGFNLEERLDKARQNIGMFTETTRNVIRMNNVVDGFRGNLQPSTGVRAAGAGAGTRAGPVAPDIRYSDDSSRPVIMDGLDPLHGPARSTADIHASDSRASSQNRDSTIHEIYPSSTAPDDVRVQSPLGGVLSPSQLHITTPDEVTPSTAAHRDGQQDDAPLIDIGVGTMGADTNSDVQPNL